MFSTKTIGKESTTASKAIANIIQPKLKISKPGDKYEEEADQTADKVLSMPDRVSRQFTVGSLQRGVFRQVEGEEEEEEIQTKSEIQRQDEEEEGEEEVQAKSEIQREKGEGRREKGLFRQPIEEEEEELQASSEIHRQIEEEEGEEDVQTKRSIERQGEETAVAEPGEGFSNNLNSSKGSGQAMDPVTRAFMESRFGLSFEKVRVHTDLSAAEMSKEISAQAFAHGSDIYFNSGRYDPYSSSGKRLLAHELTHVVQQTKDIEVLEVPDLQRALPAIAAPSIPNLADINATTRSQLIQSVRTFITSSTEADGQAAVAAVTSELESLGTIQYSGQSDIDTTSPRFLRSPSGPASSQGATPGLAGFSFQVAGINKVEIYPRAFIGDSADESLAYLAGIIIHEFIHILQNRVGGSQTDDEREFQAWLWQAEHVDELGIPPRSQGSRQILLKLADHWPHLPPAVRSALQSRYTTVRTHLNRPRPVPTPPPTPEEADASPKKENNTPLTHEIISILPKGIYIQKTDEAPDPEKELQESQEDQVRAIDPGPAAQSAQQAMSEHPDVIMKKAEPEPIKKKSPEKEKSSTKSQTKKPKLKIPVISKKEDAEEKGEIAQYLQEASQHVLAVAARKSSLLAQNEQAHDKPGKKLEQTEAAVIPPETEGQSQSNSEQVTKLNDAKAPAPDESESKSTMQSAIEDAVPSTIEALNEFKSKGKGKIVGNKVLGKVKGSVDEVKNTYQDIKDKPAPKQPEQLPKELPEEEAVQDTVHLDMGKGAVPSLKDEHTDFSEFEQQSDDLLKKEEVSEEQLEMVDEGDLADAKKERSGLKEKVTNEPSKIKEFADKASGKVSQDLDKEEAISRATMRNKRKEALVNTKNKQQETKSVLEQKRENVATQINNIYESAKQKVINKLDDLEKKNLKTFDKGQAKASKAFEQEVNSDINRWKRKRYSGIFGGVKWIKDKLFGIAHFPEVKNAFDRAKANFIRKIDALIASITLQTNIVIRECKEELNKARSEIKRFVDSLGPELRKAGQVAMLAMKDKLEEMGRIIDQKKEHLQKQLASKRAEAIKKIDEKISKMKEEMSGALSKLGNLLLNAALKFFKWALKKAGHPPGQIMNIINKGKSVIKKIVTKPIEFIGNIVKAVKGGIHQFQSNIKKHLIGGLLSWLTGAMGDIDIQLPDKFDLKGITSIVLQIMGLTWMNIRKKLVKRLGEKVVGVAEKSIMIVKKLITEGPGALWKMIKQKAAEIKSKVIEGIRNWAIVELVKQGIIKLVSFLNPAGAIVQAVLAIYNTIMFFVENINRIIQFVKTVINSISDIAFGKIASAANAVEKAMAMTIPIILNFLARLLNLSGIGKAVKKIILKIRKPIDKVLDKAINLIVKKAKSLFGRAKKGVKKVVGKGKEAIKKLKEWWKIKKKVKSKSGKTKTIYFSGGKASAKLFIKSSPGVSYSKFLESVEDQLETDNQKTAHGKATKLGLEIEKNIRSRKMTEKQAADLVSNLNKMADHIKDIDIQSELPPSRVKYGSLTKEQGATKAEALVLSYNSGGSVGTEPSDNPPVNEAVKDRKNDHNSKAYVQGHLLNHNVHGPGKRFNMTPITYTANDEHKRGIEEEVKNRVLGKGPYSKKQVIFYKVTADYGNHAESPDYVKLKNNEPRSDKEQKQFEMMEADRKLCTGFKFEAHQLTPKDDGTFKKGTDFGKNYKAVKNEIPKKAPSDIPHEILPPVNLSTARLADIAKVEGLTMDIALAIDKVRKERKEKGIHTFHSFDQLVPDVGLSKKQLSDLKDKNLIQLR